MGRPTDYQSGAIPIDTSIITDRYAAQCRLYAQLYAQTQPITTLEQPAWSVSQSADRGGKVAGGRGVFAMPANLCIPPVNFFSFFNRGAF